MITGFPARFLRCESVCRYLASYNKLNFVSNTPARQELRNILQITENGLVAPEPLTEVRSLRMRQDLGQKLLQRPACIAILPRLDYLSDAFNMAKVCADAQWEWKWARRHEDQMVGLLLLQLKLEARVPHVARVARNAR